MGYYRDLREHVEALEAAEKLFRIKREINKDTEAMPLVRCQFRGLPEAQRRAFLFENIVDAKGRKYNVPLLVACHAASTEVYAIGMKCKPEEIAERWRQAQLHSIKPKILTDGPVHEEVHLSERVLEHGGLDEFPVPISTPGFDNAPYLTAASWVTKDLNTGIRNVGHYRGMVKARDRTGINQTSANQHLRIHWEQCKAKGIPLQAAAVIGATPNIGFVATSKFVYGVDEYDIAGGIAAEPVPLVKCLTVDIEVPATAEIVIEGIIPTDSLEREAPFGEFTGYMGTETQSPYFNVTCITHRKNPIYNAFISQFPPSESSKLRHFSKEASFYKFLKYDCAIAGVLDVAFHEESGDVPFLVIKMKKAHPVQPWQVLNLACGLDPNAGKIIIAVDEDIDPRDMDSVLWALSFRMQPHRDIRISPGKLAVLDYSVAPPQEINRPGPRATGSSLLIDATIKWDYPPVSLPKKELMENAVKIWEEVGLPKLKLKTPWYGYSLGYWSKENQEEADLAVKGEYYQTGDKLARNRVKS